MKSNRYIIFRLGEMFFAVYIFDISEIINMQQPEQIPQTPKFMEGVINLRENICPVFNLRKKLELDEKNFDEYTKIIITTIDDINIGFIVDEICEIIDYEKFEPIQLFDNIINEKYIKRMMRYGDKKIIIPDLDMIFKKN